VTQLADQSTKRVVIHDTTITFNKLLKITKLTTFQNLTKI